MGLNKKLNNQGIFCTNEFTKFVGISKNSTYVRKIYCLNINNFKRLRKLSPSNSNVSKLKGFQYLLI